MPVEPLAVNSFWDFSVALYADEAVARYCLALQDDWDADVNLLLYGIWLAQHGLVWGDDEIRHLQREFEPWRTMTLLPLRTVRRRLRFQTRRRYYDFLKTLELRAERYQQDQLWLHWQATHGDAPERVDQSGFHSCLQRNIRDYLQRLEMRPRAQPMHPRVDQQMAALIEAVVAQRK